MANIFLMTRHLYINILQAKQNIPNVYDVHKAVFVCMLYIRHVCVCVCVCVRERERERERDHTVDSIVVFVKNMYIIPNLYILLVC